MTHPEPLVKRYALTSYFILTFAISWGVILLVAGPGGVLSTGEPSEAVLPFVYIAMLLGPSLAGLLLIGLVHGRSGFRQVGTRVLKWRAGARWYVIAILSAPLLWLATLLALSLASPAFLPAIIASDDKATLLLMGIAAGLVVAFFEELGWTGFAVPMLRQRFSVLTTGLIVGLLWGGWHFLVFFWGSALSSGTLPLALVLSVQLFSFLLPYRVLMVWVYDRTESLSVVILMHASLVLCTLSLAPSVFSGTQLVATDLVFAAALWLAVAFVAALNREQLSRQPLQRQTP